MDSKSIRKMIKMGPYAPDNAKKNHKNGTAILKMIDPLRWTKEPQS